MAYLACFKQNRKIKDTAMFIIASPVDNKNDVYHKINDVTNVPVYSRLKQDYMSCKQLCLCTLNLHLKFGAILSQTYKDMTLYPHMCQNVYGSLLQKNVSIQEWPSYKRL